MTYQLGIDLGTAYTAAAVYRDGRAVVVTLGDRAPSVPSAIFLKEDETILTGDAASRRAMSEPERIAREFKRRVGDPTPILLAGTPYSAEALMAKLLRWVVDKVTELEGEAPDQVTVSHPANWGPYKKDLLDQAIRMADIEHATTITEPEAAAIFYASNARVEVGSVVAVYDLGGGTFDAAVLRKTDGGWEILGQPEGVERLGGIDFDQAVFAHVRSALEGKIEELDLDDRAAISAVARLRDDCVAAKEALSSDTDATITVLLPNVSTEVRINRAELEALIRPTLHDTIGALRRALRSAGIEPADVTAVLLVGGSSRIPLVSQLVSAELGRPVAVDAHPKHAVALGAALTAGGADHDAAPIIVAPAESEPESPPPPATPLPPPPPVLTSAKKHRRAPAIALAVLLVAAGVGAFLLLGADDDGGGDSTTTTIAAGENDASDPPVALIDGITRESRESGDRYVLTLRPVDFRAVDNGAEAVDEFEVHLFWNTTDPVDAFGTDGDGAQHFRVWQEPATAEGVVDTDFFDVASRPAGASEACTVLATSLDGVPDFEDDGEPDYHVACAPLPAVATPATTVGTPMTLASSEMITIDEIKADEDGEIWIISWTQETAEISGKGHHLHFYFAGANVPPARATASAPDPIPWHEFDPEGGGMRGTVDDAGHGSSRDEAFTISAKPDGAFRICVVVVTEVHTMLDADGDSKPDGQSCRPVPAIG